MGTSLTGAPVIGGIDDGYVVVFQSDVNTGILALRVNENDVIVGSKVKVKTGSSLNQKVVSIVDIGDKKIAITYLFKSFSCDIDAYLLGIKIYSYVSRLSEITTISDIDDCIQDHLPNVYAESSGTFRIVFITDDTSAVHLYRYSNGGDFVLSKELVSYSNGNLFTSNIIEKGFALSYSTDGASSLAAGKYLQCFHQDGSTWGNRITININNNTTPATVVTLENNYLVVSRCYVMNTTSSFDMYQFATTYMFETQSVYSLGNFISCARHGPLLMGESPCTR